MSGKINEQQLIGSTKTDQAIEITKIAVMMYSELSKGDDNFQSLEDMKPTIIKAANIVKDIIKEVESNIV